MYSSIPMWQSLSTSLPVLHLSGLRSASTKALAHLFLQKPLFLQGLLQRQADPLSLCLRDDKALNKQERTA